MRRRATILSFPGLLIFGFLVAGLGLMLWRQGGLAFSPGFLSDKSSSNGQLGEFNSHAEFEKQCAQCHQPLGSLQGDLCLACHTAVANQISMESSLHGSLVNVMLCAECHSDHQGREFDLRLGNLQDFDHSILKFSLIRHQVDYSLAPMDCLACHASNDQFSVSVLSCIDCHMGSDPDSIFVHREEFGDGCIDCHDGLDTIARFNHDKAKFHLDGSHSEIACVGCHTSGQFVGLPDDCVECHSEPAVHTGIFGIECVACHDTLSWRPALLDDKTFEHGSQTNFSLIQHSQDFSGDPTRCGSCHLSSIYEFESSTCSECHALNNSDFIFQHQAQLGENCLACHDGVDRMRNFDHQEVFPLEGRHNEIDCQACHEGQIYRGTQTECKDCHPEPEIHVGFFGFKCEYCHSSISWYPAQLVSHQFPIDHGDQGEIECETCHVSTYSEYSCYGCHEHEINEILDKHKELNISFDQLAACVECHMDGLVTESMSLDE